MLSSYLRLNNELKKNKLNGPNEVIWVHFFNNISVDINPPRSSEFVSGAEDLRFKSRAGQIAHSVATSATFLRNEPCCPGAMMRRYILPTPRNSASTIERDKYHNRSATVVKH